MSAAIADLKRAAEIKAEPAPDRAAAVARVRELLAPSMKERTAPAYPAWALGPLAGPCEAISNGLQVDPAMAGQCLLGAASLLTQGLYNVETLTTPAPLSLYLMTLGDSGDGKSTAQAAAMEPVERWQKNASRDYKKAKKEFDSASRKRKKSDAALEPPVPPFRIVSDATVEGLRRDLDGGVSSQGVYTDEAAAILSGYGMSAEQRSKTAGVYSRLWDKGHLSVSRATGDRVERYGVRVSAHWLVQPVGAAETLKDRTLSDLGFWPRFGLAWPAPQAPRVHRPFYADRSPALVEYAQRCDELLAMDLPVDVGDCPVLQLEPEARELLAEAFGRLEIEARRGKLKSIKPFALRATQQACRIAGVLASFAGEHSVSAERVRGALALVAYSLDNWLSVIDGAVIDQRFSSALSLYEWLTTRLGWSEKVAQITRMGPSCVRSKDRRDEALEVLVDLGVVEVVGGVAVALTPSAA